ncbi:MAG: nucleoside phosphorylase [Atribacterota bacterium]
MKKMHHLQIEPGQIGEYVIMPGDPGRCYLIAEHFEDPQLIAQSREYITYTGKYKGLRVSVTSTGMGCPSVAIALEELIMSGAKYLVRLGSTGALQKNINLEDIIIPTSAVRLEGTSVEYIPIELPAIADIDIVDALIKAAQEKNQKSHIGIIMSHDAFYKGSVFANPDFLKRAQVWIDSNVLSVENESSALFTIGYLRKVKVGTILTVVANHLTRGVITDEEKINPIFHQMTDICLEAFKNMRKE